MTKNGLVCVDELQFNFFIFSFFFDSAGGEGGLLLHERAKQNCWQNFAYFYLTEHVQVYYSGRGGGGADCIYTLCNNQKSIGKSISAFGFQKSRKKIREPKVLRLLTNLCDFHKKIHTLGYGFQNL
jgi:hypothetical protein